MDLIRHLQCFLAVAEELHFGRAAERLRMTQPPLSQRIQRLEQELGVRLFDRTGRRVRLTEAGRLLLPEARHLMARVERVRSLADRVRRGEAGALRAGVLPDLGGPAVAALMSEFRLRRPAVELRLTETGTAEQLRELSRGQLDVGVVRHPVDPRQLQGGLEIGPVMQRPLAAVLAADGRYAAGRPVPLAELAGRALVIFPRATAPALYDEMTTTCARYGFVPTATHEVANPEFAAGLLLAGDAVGFDPGSAYARYPGLVTVPLAGDPLVWRTSAVWPRDRPAPAAAIFADVVVGVLEDLAGMSIVDSVPAPRVHPRPAAEYLP